MLDPGPGLVDGLVRSVGIPGTILEGAEEGFGLGGVVADSGPAEGWKDSQGLQSGQHGRALHWSAVV